MNKRAAVTTLSVASGDGNIASVTACVVISDLRPFPSRD